MPIKWDPQLVREALDKLEEYFGEALPALEAAARGAQAAQKILNLPQYVTGRLGMLEADLKSFPGHQSADCVRCSEHGSTVDNVGHRSTAFESRHSERI